MVEYNSDQMDAVFQALSDTTRRRMLLALTAGERTISELADPFAMSLAAVSKHVRVLESAGIVRREVRGRTHICRLDPGPLANAHAWLSFYERFWNDRIDQLERLLRAEDAARAKPPEKPPEKPAEKSKRSQQSKEEKSDE